MDRETLHRTPIMTTMPPFRAALLAPQAAAVAWTDAQKRGRRRVLAGLALAAAALAHTPTRAQGGIVTLQLQVADAESRAPLAGAIVHLDGTPRAVSDSTGRVILRGLEPGRHLLEVVMLGRRPATPEIEVAEGGVMSLEVELEPQPVALPGVTAISGRGGTARGSMARGERRGGRRHLERAEIERSSARRLSDLLIRNGAMQPDGRIRGARCAPELVVDRQPLPEADIDVIPVQDVETVDVYTIGHVPPEYAGIMVAGNCGIVEVRTRHN
jgi:hypothetical protein